MSSSTRHLEQPKHCRLQQNVVHGAGTPNTHVAKIATAEALALAHQQDHSRA